MLYRYLIPTHLLILGITLPVFFFYPNFKNYNQMQLSESQIACIQAIKELNTQLEKFQESYLQSGIAAKTTLTIEEQERADKYEKVKELSQALATVLGNPIAAFQGINKNAADKPQEGEGVSLKKKEDIGKHQFIQFVEQWVDDFKEKLGKLDNEITSISILAVRDFLKGKIGAKKFPVSQIFWQHIDKELKGLGEENTPKNIADAIVRALDGVQIDLAAEFVNNKLIYKKIKKEDLAAVTKNQDIQKLIIAPIEFYDWMIVEAKEKAKAAEEKAKAAAAEDKAFLILFNEWKKDLASELGTKDNTADSNLVSLGKLMENLELRLGHTNVYSKPIADVILLQTREKIIASKDSITVGELKKQLIPIIVDIKEHIDWDNQISLWKNDQGAFHFPIPTSIHTAIKEAKLEVSHGLFLQAFKDNIYNKQLSIIEQIAESKKWELVDDKKELPFDGKILKSELQVAFLRKIKSITPLEFIYNSIINNISDDKMSLDNLKSSWGKSIQEAYEQAKDSSSSSIYGQMIAEKPLWEIEQALDSFSAFTPTEAVMIAILEEARIVPHKKIGPKLHQYDESRTTNFSCSISWDDVKSVFEIAGKEAANQSSLTKLTELIKEQGKGIKLVIEELENVGGPFRIKIPDLTFGVKIPMKLVQYFDTSGNKIVAAIPNSLDSSDIKFNGDGGYFGFEVTSIEPLTELPKFLGKNPYVLSKDSDTCISEHQIKITADITDPQIEVTIGALGAVSLTKNPAKHTVDIILTLYSSYNLKENFVETNIKSISYVGAGKVIRDVKVINKEILKLEVFVE